MTTMREALKALLEALDEAYAALDDESDEVKAAVTSDLRLAEECLNDAVRAYGRTID